MKIRTKLNLFIICVVCLFSLTMFGFASTPATDVDDGYPVSIYMNGLKVADGIKYDSSTFVSLRDFTEEVAEPKDISWDNETGTASVSGEDYEIIATVGEQYFTANDRCFYLPDGVISIDGRVYLPIRDLADVFGIGVEWHEESHSISLDFDELEIIESAEEFYDEDDLYWLSRIINSESGNQPLDGKIAVGNVVLNRVNDPSCPDSIYEVIFDNRFGVQFSVTENGTIYKNPNDESVIAAKLCLEGFNIVEDAIYFVNPDIGVSSWFKNTRVFITTIGEHDFYA